MKKFIVLAVLALTVTGFAAAGGLVFQLGAGYHSSYYNSDLPWDVPAGDITNMPLGVGGYAGVGYGFGEKKAFSVGAEFAPSWDFSISPFGVSNFAYQIRGFVKWKPMGMLTLTGFGGYCGNAFPSDWSVSNNDWAFGGRMTILFLYAEYAAVMSNDLSGVGKHEIGVGFAFFK